MLCDAITVPYCAKLCQELARKIEELERKYSKHELEITTVFKVLKKLMEKPAVEEKPKRGIGFRRE